MRKRPNRAIPCLLALAISQSLWASTFVVDSLDDLPDANTADGFCTTTQNNCTLRAAIMQANHDGGGTIQLPVGTLHLTIAPEGTNDEASGNLNVLPSAGEILITGAGVGATVIDGRGIDNLFEIQSGGALALSRVTLVDGQVTTSGGCIDNHGYLQLSDAALSQCTAGAFGGAIYNKGIAHIDHADIRQSSAGEGGGIASYGDLELTASTVSGNTAGNGGGLSARVGSINAIVSSAIVSNTASVNGGGLYVTGDLSIVNTTIVSNSTDGYGGGILFYGYSGVGVDMFNTTIAFNQADATGGGLGDGAGLWISTNGGVVSVSNSLVAGNLLPGARAYDDCRGALTAHGDNLLGSTPYCGKEGCLPTGIEGCTISGSSTLVNSVNLLGNPGDNGGPTPTLPLLAGSNAIDAGDPGGCTDGQGHVLAVDQRGFTRPAGAACDVGAYEFGATNPNDAIFANGFD